MTVHHTHLPAARRTTDGVPTDGEVHAAMLCYHGGKNPLPLEYLRWDDQHVVYRGRRLKLDRDMTGRACVCADLGRWYGS